MSSCVGVHLCLSSQWEIPTAMWEHCSQLLCMDIQILSERLHLQLKEAKTVVTKNTPNPIKKDKRMGPKTQLPFWSTPCSIYAQRDCQLFRRFHDISEALQQPLHSPRKPSTIRGVSWHLLDWPLYPRVHTLWTSLSQFRGHLPWDLPDSVPLSHQLARPVGLGCETCLWLSPYSSH